MHVDHLPTLALCTQPTHCSLVYSHSAYFQLLATTMENNARSNPQPPPGYPTEQGGAAGSKKKGSRRARTSSRRGEGSFIEGCIAALCCCWLCELCCD